MSDYTLQVSWSGKDGLSDSDPNKIISGSEFNTEFSAVQTAINTKYDSDDLGVTLQQHDADTAKTDLAQTFTLSQRGTITTDNDLNFDLNVTNNFKCTPSGNAALTFTNRTAGQTGNILLINSAGRSISLHTNTKGDAELATTISVAGTYWLSYYSDGTNVYVVTSAVFA